MLKGLDVEEVEDVLVLEGLGIATRAQVIGVVLNSRFESNAGVQAVVVRCRRILCI